MLTRDKPFYRRIFVIMVVVEFILLFGVLLIQGLLIKKESTNIVYKSNIEKLDIIRTYSETLLGDIENIALNTAFDDNISVVDDVKDPALINSDKIFELYSLIDFLKKRVVADSRIDSIYLYHHNSDMIITSEGDICRDADFRDNAWKSYYQEDRRFRWTGKRMIRRGITESAVITLIYPYTNMTSFADYTIIVNVSLGALSDAVLSNQNEESSGFCIINSEGEIILKSAAEQFNEDTALSVEKDKSITENGVMYTCIVSDYNGWKYANASSLYNMGDNYSSITTSVVLALLIMFALGILIDWFMSRHLARPVEHLMKKINVDKASGGFEIINEAIDAMLQRENYMQQLLSNGDVRGAYLKECLNGNIYMPNPTIINTDEEYEGYIIATASVSGFAGFSAKFSEEEFNNIITVIKLMGDRVFGRAGEVIGTYTESNVWTWLIGLQNDYADITEAAHELREGIEELSGKNAVIVLNGEEFNLLADMRDVYNMCIRNKAEQVMYSHSCVMACETEIGTDPDFEYPLNKEKRIIGCIDINDKDRYIKTVSEFFTYIREKKLSSDMIYMSVNRLLGAMQTHMMSSLGGIPEDFEINLYTALMTFETLDEIELFVYNTGVRMITYQRSNNNNDEKHIKDILAFIHANYNRDIGISEIAQSVGLSYSHVRKIFSEQMNMSILSYLNKLRVDKAKEMLSSAGTTIKSIALQIGYNNEQSFSRYFKKSTGITPGEWRRRFSENKEA